MAKRRVAVLISGGGSNLQALIEATRDAAFPAEIALVISNVPEAPGLGHARRAGLPAATIDHRAFAGREPFDAALDEALHRADVELVCLAGFLRILTASFVERWRDRLLNIHPSLLPAFPGLDTHARAIQAGVRVHGCTVHLVRPTLDAGPILVQGVVPVQAGDDPATLAARVLALEHRCYPLALRLWAGGSLRLEGERAVGAEAERLLIASP